MRRDALLAGGMYLGMIVSTSVWFAIAQGFMDGRDAAGMVAAMQAAPGRFEWSILIGAAGFVFWVLLALALVRLMSHVSQRAVAALVTFVGLGAVMGLVAIAHEVDALALLRAGGTVPAADIFLAMVEFRSVFIVSMIFSALWLIPFGWLVLRCGFLPRVFGAALIAGSVFYFGNFVGPVLVAGGQASVIDSAYQASTAGKIVGVLSGVPSLVGELGTCLSLLVYGLRRERRNRSAADARGAMSTSDHRDDRPQTI